MNALVFAIITLLGIICHGQSVEQATCRKVFDIPNHESKLYKMVSNCLENVGNKTNKGKCIQQSDNIFDNPTVLGIDGIIYRNKHCAICNAVYSYSYIAINARCENASLENGDILNTQTLKNLHKCIFYIGNAKLAYPYICDFKHCTKCQFVDEDTSIKRHTCRINCESVDKTNYTTSFTINVDLKKTFSIKDFKRKFPIRHFLDVPLNYAFLPGQGLEQYLCNKYNNGRVPTTCCNCRPECMEEGNCCIDAFWDETNPMPYNSYLDWFVAKQKQQTKVKKCQPVYPAAHSFGHKTIYRMMVRSCMHNSSINDQVNCLSSLNSGMISSLPVYDSDENLYANSFCARCNMVFNYRHVNITIGCERPGEFRPGYEECTEECYSNKTYTNCKRHCMYVEGRYTMPEDCLYDFPQSLHYLGKKCKSKTSTELGSCTFHKGGKLHEICESYKASFSGYQNYHCWKCNNNRKKTDHIEHLLSYCEEECSLSSCVVDTVTRYYFLTISFSSDDILRVSTNNNHFMCQKDEILDINEMKCIKHQCPPAYEIVGGRCKERIIKNDLIIYSVNFQINHKQCFLSRNDSSMYLIFSQNYLNVNNTLRGFENSSIGKFQIVSKGKKNWIYKMENKLNYELLEDVELFLSDNQSLSLKGHEFVGLSSAIEPALISSLYGLDPARIYPNNRLCYKPKYLDIEDVTFTRNCNITIGNESFYHEDVSLWLSNENSVLVEHIAVCEEFHLSKNCLRKTLRNDETSIESLSDTLIHHHDLGTDRYLPKDYIPVKNGFSVCVTQYENALTDVKWSEMILILNIGHYLSIIFMSISCFCYAWIITTYLMAKSLRTIPGFNTVFLCMSLLLSDGLFLTSQEAYRNAIACTAVAIIFHWSSLCVYTWTVIIAVDLASRFSSKTLASRDYSKKKIIRRCLLAFLTPTAIIAISVTLDTTSTVAIGYGLKNFCWITNLYARLGLYIIPVGCTIVFSLLSLVYTLAHIHRASKESEEVLNRKRKSLIKIALKLVIVLGITEFIGFLQIPGSSLSKNEVKFNTAFKFIYSIVRSCRGMMLWFVYIFSARVFRKYKLRFMKAAEVKHVHRQEQGNLLSKITASTS